MLQTTLHTLHTEEAAIVGKKCVVDCSQVVRLFHTVQPSKQTSLCGVASTNFPCFLLYYDFIVSSIILFYLCH